jgi:hypothetical protein
VFIFRFYLFGSAAMQTAFRIVTRKSANGQHPVLVFDLENRLHFPLTIFAMEAVKRSSVGTARTYLNAILALREGACDMTQQGLVSSCPKGSLPTNRRGLFPF